MTTPNIAICCALACSVVPPPIRQDQDVPIYLPRGDRLRRLIQPCLYKVGITIERPATVCDNVWRLTVALLPRFRKYACPFRNSLMLLRPSCGARVYHKL